VGLTIFAIISIAVFIAFYRLFGLPTRSAREFGKRRSPLVWADKSGDAQKLDLHPIAGKKLDPLPPPVPDRLPLISFRFTTPLVEISPTFPLPNYSIEESLLLRVLVQGMATIGFMGTDLAIGTQFSWLAIPITIGGSSWSWYRRRYDRDWLSWLVVGVMLTLIISICTPFFYAQAEQRFSYFDSVGTSKTIPIILVFILAIGQMGVSWISYTRQALGYGMIMSTLSIAIAGMVSQNVFFILLAMLFIGLAIGGLMLDYRSRIHLPPIGVSDRHVGEQLPYYHLPRHLIIKFTAIVLATGCTLSLFFPNLRLPEITFHRPPFPKPPQTISQKLPLTPPNIPTPSPSNPPELNHLAAQVLGQPQNQNYPPEIKAQNLQLPPDLAVTFQKYTQKILANASPHLNSDYDRVAYLGAYLKQNYPTTPSPSPQPSTIPPQQQQILKQLLSQCQQQSKNCPLTGEAQDLPVLYTSMLRSIGIPARLKVDDRLGNFDAHTPPNQQTEVYFSNLGWLPLDPQRDRPLLPSNPQTISQLQQQLTSLPSPSPSPPSSSTPQQSNSPIPQPTNTPTSPPALTWKPDLFILRLLAIALMVAGAIIWYLSRQRQEQQKLAAIPPVERIYRLMLMDLSKRGLSKQPAQTQLEYAQTARDRYPTAIGRTIWEISQLYTAWRYGKKRIDLHQLAKKYQYLVHLQQVNKKGQK
jgi:hypothetical protein